MKKITQFLLFILLATTLIIGCKKNNPIAEIDKLPPATQTGANTFGCLVNGKAWVAQRNDCSIICDPYFKLNYDNIYGGYIGIEANMIQIDKAINQKFEIIFDSSNHKLIHDIKVTKPHSAVVYKNLQQTGGCSRYDNFADPTVIHDGIVTISRYDLSNGIISGTFQFSISKTGCETLIVTNGRFDKKL